MTLSSGDQWLMGIALSAMVTASVAVPWILHEKRIEKIAGIKQILNSAWPV